MNTACQTSLSLSFTGNRLFEVNRSVIFRDNGLARKIYCFNNVVTTAVTVAVTLHDGWQHKLWFFVFAFIIEHSVRKLLQFFNQTEKSGYNVAFEIFQCFEWHCHRTKYSEIKNRTIINPPQMFLTRTRLSNRFMEQPLINVRSWKANVNVLIC